MMKKKILILSLKKKEDNNNTEPNILRQEKSNTLTEDDIINHDSVWAIYNLKCIQGKSFAKYIEDLNIEFYEGTYNIKNVDLNVLDIRIGDTVNIKGNRHKYIVTGLSTLTTNGGGGDIKCMRGIMLFI